MAIVAGWSDADPKKAETEEAKTAATSLGWSATDTYYTSIFGGWPNLPIDNSRPESRHERLPLLRELDDVISKFDEYIFHSDDGFRAWRALHQTAMELYIVETPTYPKLWATSLGDGGWDDELWERRYCYLVQQREKLALDRLAELGENRGGRGLSLFGWTPESPVRQTLVSRKKSPRPMRCNWYEPLDFLLQARAESSNCNAEFYKARFWGAEYRAPVTVHVQVQTQLTDLRVAKDNKENYTSADEKDSQMYDGRSGYDGVFIKSEPM